MGRSLQQHPTVVALRRRGASEREPAPPPALDPDRLREIALVAGADDVGFVPIDDPAVDTDRDDILLALPRARTLVAFVVRMNPDSVRAPFRSVANLEFHHASDESNEVARRIVDALHEAGGRALNPAIGFPMEMDRSPGKIWVVSHKRIAEAAGLGVMGIHRNVIHPKFGNFILLGTVITDLEVSRGHGTRLDYNPCLECKLCVAACPVGAISPEGRFDFGACYTHNYREFMSGFTAWVEQIADSRDARDYRKRVPDTESASMWQSLSFGANYKAAYCMAVCPAGEEVIGPFLANRKGFVADVMRPLQRKAEPVFVVPGSDAEAHVKARFPEKTPRPVSNGLRVRSIAQFASRLPQRFSPGKAAGLRARYHFVFTGAEPTELTVTIDEGSLQVLRGLQGEADLRIEADSTTWLDFLAKNVGLLRAVLTRRLKIRGPVKLMKAFGACFP
jgi:ferredoxin